MAKLVAVKGSSHFSFCRYVTIIIIFLPTYSFTMQGPSTVDENLRGVIPNSFLHIFQFVKSTKDIEFLIRCSYLELYNEEIRDLLGNPKHPQKCELKEDPQKGIYVKGVTDVVVESPEDLNHMFEKGLTNRTVASTLMNSESSRSHSIFTIVIEMNTKDPISGKDMLRVGKLNLGENLCNVSIFSK
jgi:kinesin family member 17